MTCKSRDEDPHGPVEHLFRRFPRVVRDVAKSCGKEVNLIVTGQDTDLDKEHSGYAG